MREDIAEMYRSMKSSRPPVMYSDAPPDEESSSSVEADESDFELSHSMLEDSTIDDGEISDDTDFDLAAGVSSDDGEADSTYDMPTYSMDTPEVPAENADSPAAETAAAAMEPAAEAAADDDMAADAGKSASPAAEGGDEEATAEKSAGADETAAVAEKAASAGAGSSPDHSVATGGDALLQIAMQEEEESGQRRGRRRSTGSLRIFCPYGHRVDVQERHRGKLGRCPKCRSQFIVPEQTLESLMALARQARAENKKEAGGEESKEPSPGGRFSVWLKDVRVHAVDPTKLKLRPGSLESSYQPMDLGLADDGFLLVDLHKKGGMFGGGPKNVDAEREAMLAHLSADGELKDLPAVEHVFYGSEEAGNVNVVQPAPYVHESMFAGVPVFGEGRIAVRLPEAGSSGTLRFLSFGLAEFRKLQQEFEKRYEIRNFGATAGIPLEDSFSEYECHYTENPIKAVDSWEFYEADPQSKVELAGWKCGACGLVVSEDARRKEKIGGRNPKGLAKAKCPKCGGVFGSNPLYALCTPEQPAEEESEAE